jgi:hypothetical protein
MLQWITSKFTIVLSIYSHSVEPCALLRLVPDTIGSLQLRLCIANTHIVVSGICQWQDNHSSSVLLNDWSLFSITLPSNIQETKPSNSLQSSWTLILILQLWIHESLRLLSFTVRSGNKTFVNFCNSCTEHDSMISTWWMSHFWIQLYWKQVLLAFIVLYKLSKKFLNKVLCTNLCDSFIWESSYISFSQRNLAQAAVASDLYSGGSQFDSCPEHRLFMVIHCSFRQMPG